jgi:hypothetical protein
MDVLHEVSKLAYRHYCYSLPILFVLYYDGFAEGNQLAHLIVGTPTGGDSCFYVERHARCKRTPRFYGPQIELSFTFT